MKEHLWDNELIPAHKLDSQGNLREILGVVYCKRKKCVACREYDYPVGTNGIKLSQFTRESKTECKGI